MRKRTIRIRRKEFLARERKRKNCQNRLLIGLFLVFVFGGTLATLIVPAREFSDRENRALEQFPKISMETILDGTFARDYETYLSDQFPLRDAWISIKAGMERLIGKQEIKDIYYAADDYLIESHKGVFDTEQAQRNITYLADFLNSQKTNFQEGHITAMVIPNAVEILKEKLPQNAPDSGEAAYLQKIANAVGSDVWFDSASVLNAHKEEYLYYRTDHHWTTLAAFYTYEAWAKAHGFEPASLELYTRETLTDSFMGTIESKVGTDVVPDKIERFMRADAAKYLLDYNNGQKTGNDLYAMETLSTKDKYGVFFGGNQPIIKATVNNGSERKLLVIKDSYAHCFIPFTFEHYGQVDFIDLRYFNQSLQEHMETSGYTDLLFLYNAAGFAEDVSLLKLKN